MTRVLITFDKFKDALSAEQAGEVIAGVLRGIHADWQLDLAPLSDGGEGFARILTRAARGREVNVLAAGPRGARHSASFGMARIADIPPAARSRLALPATGSPDGTVAIIEMAAVNGLALLPAAQRDPWVTTTFGTGEMMRAAADAGAVAILLGVGGSATNDLGLGALAALGVQPVDGEGNGVAAEPAQWARIAGFAGDKPASFPPVYIACDVTNPLLGPRGAAAVYGPQKGLRPQDLGKMEEASQRLAGMLCDHCHQPRATRAAPGGGAAGGLAFGLMVGLGAQLLPGFSLVSAWLDLDARIAAADWVITGEGRFDASSLEGKGPGEVVTRALALEKVVHVFAGQVTTSARPGLAVHAITPPGSPLTDALRECGPNLAAAARGVFRR